MTMRAIGRAMSHSSSASTGHTISRSPSGSLSGLRPSIAEQFWAILHVRNVPFRRRRALVGFLCFPHDGGREIRREDLAKVLAEFLNERPGAATEIDQHGFLRRGMRGAHEAAQLIVRLFRSDIADEFIELICGAIPFSA